MTERTRATALGVLALLFWGSTIAFSRGLSEKLGAVTAAASIYVTGGIIACLILAIRGGLGGVGDLSRRYLAGCGSLFVVYTVALYLAVGVARSREQVIEIGLINYLWPSLTLLFSLPILGASGRWTLFPGIALAFGGVALAMLSQTQPTIEGLASRLVADWVAYVAGLIAAVTWGLYNNLSRRWAGRSEGNAVPIFILVTGLMLAAVAPWFDERRNWSVSILPELLYLAVFPTVAAYELWDRAMRKGSIVLLASASYLTPVLSTVISGLYLGVPLGVELCAACALVVAGAALCRVSVIEESRESKVESV